MVYIKGANKGFSLIELLIAMTIFAVGLLSIAKMQICSMQSNAFASSLSVATGVAQGVLEEVRAKEASDPIFRAPGTTTYSHDFFPEDLDREDLPMAGAGTYRAVYTISTNNPASNLARIDVSVRNVETSRAVSLSGFKRTL